MPSNLYRSCLLFSVLLAAVLSLFYLPFIMGWQSYYLADLTYYFQPFTDFIVSQYRQGRIPTWNPYLYCGMSQIAVPSPGMFYPPIIFFVMNSFSSGLAMYLLFHQVVAGAGAFLLIGAIGWGIPAAIMGGIAVACCGYMFALKSNYTLVASIAWLPLLMFSLWKIGPRFDQRNLLWVGATALMTFFTIAAGRPEISVPCGICAAAFSIASALYSKQLPTLGWRCLAGIAGLLLAAPIILPAIEWVRLSPRSQGLELRWVLMWSANWYDMLCLIFAQPLGDLTELGSKYLNMVASRPNAIPYLTSSYVGPVVFTFAIWGFLDKTWSWRWWIIGAIVITTLMALGENTSFAPTVAGSSPALAAFRYPVKLMVLPALCLIIASARGIHRATESRLSIAAQIVSAIIWGLVLLLGIVFLLSPELAQLTLRFPWNAPNSVNLEVMMEAQVLFARSLISGAIVGILICWTTWLVRKEQLPVLTYSAMVLCGLTGTLLAPAVMYDRTGTAGDFFTRPLPIAERLKQIIGMNGQNFNSRILPTYFDPLTLPPDFSLRHALPFQQAFYQNSRQLLLPNANVAARVPYAFGYEAAETGNFKKFFSQSISVSTQNRYRDKAKTDTPLARFCKLSAVSHILTQVYYGKPLRAVPTADPKLFTLVSEDRDNNLRIYKCKQMLPRAYWAGKVIPAPSWEDFDRRAMEDAPNDMLSETMIEGVKNSQPEVSIKTVDTNGIEFSAQQFDYVSLNVKTDAPRHLVLVDHYYPGWEAKIDGQTVPVRRTNLFFRSVEVPQGSHLVEFQYRPMSLMIGFTLAGTVVIGFLGLFLVRKFLTAVVPKEKSDVLIDVTV